MVGQTTPGPGVVFVLEPSATHKIVALEDSSLLLVETN